MATSDSDRPAPLENTVSGTIFGPSVQALDIHGGIHYHGAGVPARAIPRQSAAPPRHFTARQSELEALKRAAEAGSTVVVLSGPGGVGKTALARHYAHQAADAYPDGQLYVNLDGFGSPPAVDPADALRAFLRALGVPGESLPVTLAELTALYRSHTAGRALLVVLDDAFSAAQVRVLLPASSSSLTVVTSRSRLSGLIAEGATFVDVPPLTAGESTALLAAIVGGRRIDDERQQSERLAELCAGLPIALCVVAARLSTRPRLSVAGVVAALADTSDRLARLETPNEETSVSGSFELSYRALDGPAAVLYRRLALHPGPEFGMGPASALLPGIRTESPADRLMGVLLEVNLLQEVAENRFGYHPLLRLFARQKAAEDDTEADRDGALVAMLEWYLGAAGAADVASTPYRRRLAYAFRTDPVGLPAFGDRDHALSWLDRERANLGLAGQAALDRGWAELAWHLTDVMWPLQLYRKSVDRREIDERGLAAARLWGEPHAEGRMLKRLGRTCSTAGEYGRAEQLLRAAITTYRQAGDVAGRIEAEEMLALVYRDSGDDDAAIDMLGSVLTDRRRLGDSRDIGLTLINLGELLSRRGRAAEAIGLLRESGTLLDRSVAADPYNLARVKLGLARAYLAGGDLVAAAHAATEAVEGMRRLGAAVGEADALEIAGEIAERRGDPTRGRLCLERAVEILEAHGSPRAVALRRRLPAPPGVQERDQLGQMDGA
ncbi:tetratricopeptide repeat protein [Actinoplanes sp. NPDC048988]|uniref:tetratricopeptide repeat protein n=1 Tax=Actinoplanes sp. NPDC048988 TaxID=3363901 RepID=UPI00371C2E77